MKIKLVSPSTPNAMRLQSVGWVQGYSAANIKAGDSLVWNFGSITTVNSVSNVSARFIEIVEVINGTEYKRKLLKTRNVAIVY